jgi:methylglutamate dehydrogenase subunit C
MSGTRLPQGGMIDRGSPLRFSFDGRGFEGFAGDTLASALLAAGVQLVGRSFKYHRPRGIVGLGSEEANALVELRCGQAREPNSRATTTELYEGLEARSQNRWPSLKLDAMAVNSLFSPLFAAGFYYKTFMWPAALWERLYEPLIRRAAGLGRAAEGADPDRYIREHLFADCLVIGAGPAGIAAALAAARAGARVVLADEDAHPGGRLLAERKEIAGLAGADWVQQSIAELDAMPRVTRLTRTTVFGVYDHGVHAAVERVSDHLIAPMSGQPRQRLWIIEAKRTILASGASERPIAFGGNDRPGVMAAGAMRGYANRYGVAPGKAISLFVADDSGWQAAEDLLAAGCTLAALIDPRPDVDPVTLSRLRRRGVPVFLAAQVTSTQGHLGLREITVRNAIGQMTTIATDALGVSGGWNPVVHLSCHLGGRPIWDDTRHCFVPGVLPKGMSGAGAVRGLSATSECLADGFSAGVDAAGALGFCRSPGLQPTAQDATTIARPFWIVPQSTGKAFVDLQHDVTVQDIALAAREGFRSVEHLKRYTTLGMATDQGKASNVLGIALLADVTGRSIAETGTTVFRPPYTPVTMGAIAGHAIGKHLKPTRYTPSHHWAVENGASFVESGLWQRTQWYVRKGETGWRDSVDREALAVRASVGVCDVSTLGKIEVLGRDAGAFLDVIYTGMISTLAIGKVRYGLMLRDDGFVFDDGTVARLAADRFFITTTTANAARVLQHLEFCHEVDRPEMAVAFASVTDRWAQFSIAGPQARAVIAQLVDAPFDVSNAAFPHMSAAEVSICGGTPGRLLRLSFSGELAYEIAVPGDRGDAFIRRIMEAGASFGITPYGLEALNVLRIEKGHPVGAELNGQTTAADLGLGGLLSTRKDYIGRRLMERPELARSDRAVLVGLRPERSGEIFLAGAHLFDPRSSPSIEADDGHVTSVCFSPTVGETIGLGLLKRGRSRFGERVLAHDPIRNRNTMLRVTSPVFVDPAGERTRQ